MVLQTVVGTDRIRSTGGTELQVSEDPMHDLLLQLKLVIRHSFYLSFRYYRSATDRQLGFTPEKIPQSIGALRVQALPATEATEKPGFRKLSIGVFYPIPIYPLWATSLLQKFIEIPVAQLSETVNS